ncbi:MAG: flagellar protein FliS [Pirellulaceae bacterium]|nr:flagellar protein FliS [Pirellulaceae bacterium]
MLDLPANPYLEQEVLTASPAKLRWLLINKSVQLCRIVDQLWQVHDYAAASQWTLRLRDVITELLSGVHGTDPLSKRVADLYVFMLKLLTQAEQSQEIKQLHELQGLLEIEAETWLLVQQQSAGVTPGQSLGETAGAGPHLLGDRPTTAVPYPTFNLASDGESSFSIDA